MTYEKQNLFKSMLCLLLGLVCNVAWAQQPKASDTPVDGQWAENTTWYQIKTGNGYYFRSDILTDDGTLNLFDAARTATTESVGLWYRRERRCLLTTEHTDDTDLTDSNYYQ